MTKTKVSKKEKEIQKEFKRMVLGKPKNVFGKPKRGRKKRGTWDIMYGGAEEEEKKKTGKKPKNFWVDTDVWFRQDY